MLRHNDKLGLMVLVVQPSRLLFAGETPAPQQSMIPLFSVDNALAKGFALGIPVRVVSVVFSPVSALDVAECAWPPLIRPSGTFPPTGGRRDTVFAARLSTDSAPYANPVGRPAHRMLKTWD